MCAAHPFRKLKDRSSKVSWWISSYLGSSIKPLERAESDSILMMAIADKPEEN